MNPAAGSGSSHYHRLKIGVMGAASGPLIEDPVARDKAKVLGREIGARGHIFINGACPGLPHDAMLAAKEQGGFTIGISPAFSEYEHVNEYLSPHEHDFLIYTGMGFMSRDVINIRSADGVVIISGGVGTLNELTIAYDEGRPIGVVTNSGGISNHIESIIRDLCKREIPPNMVFDDDPAKLLDKLETAIRAFPLPYRQDSRVRDKKLPG
ncbi:MAG: LOG family protein [Candidatus Peribacteraceae bacterium]|nr:LOG family protein [Candidatus Peribacteraceae bacterium]